jgi:hypothetical protein
MVHRESLATKELCPELSEVVDTVIKTVNYIKTRPLEIRLVAELCEKMGESISRSCFTVILWRGNNGARVYNSREEVALFLEEENLAHVEHFRHEHFVPKLAYLNYTL